mgnify:CR=1 FL=1
MRDLAAVFDGITEWVFDLDNTLYPRHCDLFAQIDWKMTDYVAALLNLPKDEARKLQKEMYREYGTTLRGLMVRYDIDMQFAPVTLVKNERVCEDIALLTFDRKDQLQVRWLHQKTGKRLTPPSHHLPSSHGFVAAAQEGLGWGMNPAPLVQKDMEKGRLVSLDEALPLDVPLYWQVARIMAPALAPLTAAIKAAARGALVQGAS